MPELKWGQPPTIACGLTMVLNNAAILLVKDQRLRWRMHRVTWGRGERIVPQSSSTAPLAIPIEKSTDDHAPTRRVELPETGVEPARPYGHKHLKLARLPIPPPGRLLLCEFIHDRRGVNLSLKFRKR